MLECNCHEVTLDDLCNLFGSAQFCIGCGQGLEIKIQCKKCGYKITKTINNLVNINVNEAE